MTNAQLTGPKTNQILLIQRALDRFLGFFTPAIYAVSLITVVFCFVQDSPVLNKWTLIAYCLALLATYGHIWSFQVRNRHDLPTAATASELAAFERNQAAFLESIKRDLDQKAQVQLDDALRKSDTDFSTKVSAAIDQKLTDELLSQLGPKVAEQLSDASSKSRLTRLAGDRAAQAATRYLALAEKAEQAGWHYRTAATVLASFGVLAAVCRIFGWPPLGEDPFGQLPDAVRDANWHWIMAIKSAPIIGLVLLSESLALLFLRQYGREMDRQRIYAESATLSEQRLIGASLAIERGSDKDISTAAAILLSVDGKSASTNLSNSSDEDISSTIEKIKNFIDKYNPLAKSGDGKDKTSSNSTP